MHKEGPACFGCGIVVAETGVGKRIDAEVYVAVVVGHEWVVGRVDLYVPGLEGGADLVGAGYYKIRGEEEQQSQEDTAHPVGEKHAVEAGTAGEDGDDLAAACHFGCKEDNRNKYKQREEHGCDERDEAEVILRDDVGKTEAGFNKIVGFFTHVDHYGDDGKEQYRKKEGRKKFLEYVPVEFLHRELFDQ